MGKKRRTFPAGFKSKVALAAAKGDKTLAELASQYELYSNQISAWKKQLLPGMSGLFEEASKRKPRRRGCSEKSGLGEYFRLQRPEASSVVGSADALVGRLDRQLKLGRNLRRIDRSW